MRYGHDEKPNDVGLELGDRNPLTYSDSGKGRGISELFIDFPELSDSKSPPVAKALRGCKLILIEEYSIAPIMYHNTHELYQYLYPIFGECVLARGSIKLLVSRVVPWIFYSMELYIPKVKKPVRVAYGTRDIHSLPVNGYHGYRGALLEKH